MYRVFLKLLYEHVNLSHHHNFNDGGENDKAIVIESM